MRPKAPAKYLAGYPPALVEQVQRLIDQDQLAGLLLQKYPVAHAVRTDRALYDYVADLKNAYLRNAGPVNKAMFDGKLQVVRHALGTHTRLSRVQGARLQAKREIRVASIFKDLPATFLRMIVVHELAHLKEQEHDKAFYQLCRHMEPDYPQLEFDLRAYLSYLEATGRPLWSGVADAVRPL
jgi:predicted metal-dependent hydrolase